mgnify:CR=1 FL=1
MFFYGPLICHYEVVVQWVVAVYEPNACGVLLLTVEIADILIDNGVFPFSKCVKKFDKFPPGQAATKNKPNAILGLGCKMSTSKNVNAGNNKN